MSTYTMVGAILSGCGVYRYRLWRIWDPERPRLLWVMLNPSTADASKDDQTILTIVAFAKLLGYGGIEVVNLYAFRARDPRDLKTAGYLVGPENDAHVRAVADAVTEGGGRIVAAWGAHAKETRATQMMGLLSEFGRVFHLGLTKRWQPRHPLYVKRDTPLQEWAADLV